MDLLLLRLAPFIIILSTMLIWEGLNPRRPRSVPRKQRWPANVGMVIFNTFVLRLLFPTAAIGAAVIAEQQHWGVFNQIPLPALFAVVFSVILLDFAIYGQHVMVHKVPLFWRFHQMHHSDVDLDITSGLRFHPLEIIFSMLIKYAVIFLLGAPALAVILFEILLNSGAMFNHSNVRIPEKIDRGLRWFIVTPDMHRIHHSVIRAETDSNYGFSLTWWDRLFGTYTEVPAETQLGMTIGLPVLREAQHQTFLGLLKQPFIEPSNPKEKY